VGSVRAGLAILALTLAGCTSGGSAPAPTPAPSTSSPAPAPTTPTPSGSSTQATASWPTYHGSNSRAGLALTGAPHLPLRVGWSKDIDGAVYAQPIVVGDTVEIGRASCRERV